MTRGAAAADRSLEGRLGEHVDSFGMFAVAVGLLVSLQVSSATYLNPDEAQHVCAAAASTLRGAIERSCQRLAHPPLLTMLEHVVIGLGRSEWLLRLPSVLAVAASQWLIFKWMRRIADPATSLAVLVLLVGSPAALAAGTQVRQYGLLLLGIGGTLYAMEQMLEKPSPTAVAAFSVFLYVAILAHYSGAWVAIGLGVYVALRLIVERRRGWLVWGWGLSQVGAVALYVWLYVTQLSRIRGGAMESYAMSMWLHKAYFHPGEESLWVFAWRTISGSFAYCAGGQGLGVAAGGLFALGLLAIVTARTGPGIRMRRDQALLLSLPIALGCAGALAGLLPFGRTRHATYVLPFVAAGAGIGLGRLLRAHLFAVLIPSLLLLPVWLWSERPPNDPARMRRDDLVRALDSLKSHASPDALLVVDDQTRYLLCAYLDPNAAPTMPQRGGVEELRLGDWRVAYVPQEWSIGGAKLPGYLERISRALALAPEQPLWLISLSLRAPRSAAALPPGTLVREERFGDITLAQAHPRAGRPPRFDAAARREPLPGPEPVR